MKRQVGQMQASLFLWVFLPLVVDILLHSLLLTPLYLSLASDIVWSGSTLVRAIGYLQLFLEYAFYWLLFAYLIRIFGKRKIAILALLVFALLLVRQGLELYMGYVAMGFPTLREFYTEELSYTLLQLLFDGVLLALAALLIRLVKRPDRRAFLLSLLPFAFQLISLAVMLISYGSLSGAEWLEAALDLVFHIICLFAGFGVILLLDRHFERKEIKT